MSLLKRRVRIFGRSIPLGVILVLALFTVAMAAILLLVSNPFSGNIVAVDYSIVDSYTSDDGLVNGLFDENDLGPDPMEAFSGGPTAREAFDVAYCLSNPNATSTDISWTDTYSSAYCAVFIEVQNDGADILDFISASLVGTAPIDLRQVTATCTAVAPGASDLFVVDLSVNPAAVGGDTWAAAGNSIDLTFALDGTDPLCP